MPPIVPNELLQANARGDTVAFVGAWPINALGLS
jgi:hypothetical protein